MKLCDRRQEKVLLAGHIYTSQRREVGSLRGDLPTSSELSEAILVKEGTEAQDKAMSCTILGYKAVYRTC